MLEGYGPMCPSQISTRERTSRATTSKLLQRLEREGLVRRDENHVDARSYLVELTEQGRTSLQQWRARVATALVPPMETLTAQERETLVQAEAILHKLISQLEGN